MTGVALCVALTACGGGDSSSSSTSSGSGSGSGSSGTASGCNYTDLISASERAQANQCGIQVSASFGTADARLRALIDVCKAGNRSAADADYKGPYTTLVQHARNTASSLSCGSGGGTSIEPPSALTYYNLCGTTTSSRRSGVCYGPVRKGDGSCSSGTHINQYASLDSCQTAGAQWQNGR